MDGLNINRDAKPALFVAPGARTTMVQAVHAQAQVGAFSNNPEIYEAVDRFRAATSHRDSQGPGRRWARAAREVLARMPVPELPAADAQIRN